LVDYTGAQFEDDDDDDDEDEDENDGNRDFGNLLIRMAHTGFCP